MTNDQLRASIARVKEIMKLSLETSERDLFGHLMSAIIEGPKPISEPQLVSITEQLDEQAVSFESEHPQLAKSLRELIDTLNKMGV